MPEDRTPSSAFLELFRRHADAQGRMSFARFMALALYDPALGYYRQPRRRVGYAPGTDFYTASTSGAVFGELVVAACESLLGREACSKHRFVEIGAEPGGEVLREVKHPFAASVVLRPDDTLALAGRCIVFSNEVFDAQPFHRFRRTATHWAELGVALQDGQLVEVVLDAASPDYLPSDAAPGYVIDAPSAARDLAQRIATQPWTGLFLAFDYGKTWAELSAEQPAGTARAYHRHQQSNDLLARPGEQDLTCHICWDWLEDELAGQGFRDVAVEPQESFFVRRATSYIAHVSESDAAGFSRRKLSLLQLLHPGHLGQKFQVLHAQR